MSFDTRCYYRGSDELALALRDWQNRHDQFVADVVKPFLRMHPDNAPLQWDRGGVRGFADGKPLLPPPEGLSRARNRKHLMPTRDRAGKYWRDAEQHFQEIPRCSAVFSLFAIPSERMDFVNAALCLTSWCRLDGVTIVYTSYPFGLEPLPSCLTRMKLSTFYTLYERDKERTDD